MTTSQYDVFICYAVEDKPTLVAPLADRLQSHGLAVWYDDFVVRWGDSISDQIADGLRRSRNAILVLSPDFLNKHGIARQELRGLWQRQAYEQPVILPLRHGVTVETVRLFDPTLADLAALDTATADLDEIARRALHALRGGKHGTEPAAVDLRVRSLGELRALGRDTVLQRQKVLAGQARVSPNEASLALSLGICDLHLKRFHEAAAHLRRTIGLEPDLAGAHYHLALALLAGRPPRALSLPEARAVLDGLDMALALDAGRAEYELLTAAVKYGYFRMNGLRCPPPDFADHARRGREGRAERADLEALLDLVPEAARAASARA